MTIEEFWNQAFLAALHRLPVPQAKLEADEATNTCIDHWHLNWENRSLVNAPRVEDTPIGSVYKVPDATTGKVREDGVRFWVAPSE